MKYHEINDLHQRRLALRREITDIGNDMDYLIKNMPRGEEEEEDPPVPPVINYSIFYNEEFSCWLGQK